MAQSGLTYETLETAFQHGNFKPLYLFYGEERFLIDSLQALLIEKALAPHERDFNLDILYGSETTAQEALARCSGYPMMAPRRVVIIRDFDKLKDNQRFKAFAERPNPTAVVLLVCSGKPNLSAHPYRALRQHAAWAEFKPLYERQIPGWIDQRVQQKGYRIEPRALQMLSEFVGTDLRTADAEIDKLITYAGGRATLTADDVLAATGQTREYNVFELQRAIGAGRYPDALRIAERLLQQASNARSEGLMIVSVLTSYFMKLWKLTECQTRGLNDRAMATRIGVSPYFIKEYLTSLRRYGPGAIARAFATLLAADYELKGGGSRNERLVLALMLRRIMA
ncbi:MAG: DNA polymerase III subunit delta [Bacteroidetes bacterium]|nr:MAG: DNA polymerase III subunit delta [Bacteroidota bacterium]GIV57766.1 MAG: DNA polymerase III subunit delta [Rhodothermaceae bacterium]